MPYFYPLRIEKCAYSETCKIGRELGEDEDCTTAVAGVALDALANVAEHEGRDDDRGEHHRSNADAKHPTVDSKKG